MRLDKELVIRGLAPTRTKAQELINNKYVKVNDMVVTKLAYDIKSDDSIEIISNDTLKYVSRGGLKLEKAIEEFKIDFNDKVIMDIGSSTGGFTDCALKHGAKKVIAIDVGTDVMTKDLRLNKKVELHEQLNIKDADSSLFNGVDIIVSDVSFISIKKVLDRIVRENRKYDLVILIKPQFECGYEIATKYKGVILNKDIHLNILNDVISYFEENGYYLNNLTQSPIKGGDGNIEYLSYFNNIKKEINYLDIINKAFKL